MFAELLEQATPRRHPVRRRPLLPSCRSRPGLEPLEYRLCPTTFMTTVSGTSPVNLFPGVTLHMGETVHIQVSVDSGDASEGTENETEGVTISSTGGLAEFVPMFGQDNITYKVQQNGETITGVSQDSDDIGNVVAERGAGLLFVNVPRTGVAGQPLTPPGGDQAVQFNTTAFGKVTVPIAPPPGPAKGFTLAGTVTATNGITFVQGQAPIEVQVLNSNGDLDGTFNGDVAITLPAPQLSEGAQAHGGVAMFPDLGVITPSLAVTLVASAQNHDAGFSDPIQVLAPQFFYGVSKPEPATNSPFLFVHDHVGLALGGTWDPTGGPIHVTLSGSNGTKMLVADVPPPASGETASDAVIFPDWPDNFGVGLLMAYQGDLNNPQVGILYPVGGKIVSKALFAQGVSVLQGRQVHTGDFIFQGETSLGSPDFGLTVAPDGALVVTPNVGAPTPNPAESFVTIGIVDPAAGITLGGGNGLIGAEIGAGGTLQVAGSHGTPSPPLHVPLPPDLTRAEFLSMFEPRGASVLRERSAGAVTIASTSIAQQGLTVNGSLTLRQAVLFVDGNLIVRGGISGVGAIFVTGNIIQGGGPVNIMPIQEAVFLALGDIQLGGTFPTFTGGRVGGTAPGAGVNTSALSGALFLAAGDGQPGGTLPTFVPAAAAVTDVNGSGSPDPVTATQGTPAPVTRRGTGGDGTSPSASADGSGGLPDPVAAGDGDTTAGVLPGDGGAPFTGGRGLSRRGK